MTPGDRVVVGKWARNGKHVSIGRLGFFGGRTTFGPELVKQAKTNKELTVDTDSLEKMVEAAVPMVASANTFYRKTLGTELAAVHPFTTAVLKLNGIVASEDIKLLGQSSALKYLGMTRLDILHADEVEMKRLDKLFPQESHADDFLEKIRTYAVEGQVSNLQKG